MAESEQPSESIEGVACRSSRSWQTSPKKSSESIEGAACRSSRSWQTAPDVLLKEITNEVNKDDVRKIVDAQRHMLSRFEKTNEMLSTFNTISASRYETAQEEFKKYVHLLASTKKDLDAIFRRIRALKTRLSQQYTEAFNACQSSYKIPEEHDDIPEVGDREQSLDGAERDRPGSDIQGSSDNQHQDRRGQQESENISVRAEVYVCKDGDVGSSVGEQKDEGDHVGDGQRDGSSDNVEPTRVAQPVTDGGTAGIKQCDDVIVDDSELSSSQTQGCDTSNSDVMTDNNIDIVTKNNSDVTTANSDIIAKIDSDVTATVNSTTTGDVVSTSGATNTGGSDVTNACNSDISSTVNNDITSTVQENNG